MADSEVQMSGTQQQTHRGFVEKMHAFGKNIGRTVRAVCSRSRSRSRNERPAKRRELRRDIREDLESPVDPSPVSQLSQRFARLAEVSRRPRNERPAKLQKRRRNIRKDLGPSAEPSPVPQLSQRPPREADEVNIQNGPMIEADTTQLVQSSPDHEPNAVVTENATRSLDALDEPYEDAAAVNVEMDDGHEMEQNIEQMPMESFDEQAIRDRSYIVFEGEDETDYTAGPPRMVLASDGVRHDCGGLLMTLDLSAKIQEAVRAQRRYAKFEERTKDEDRVNFNFEGDLNRQIARHKWRKITLEGGGESGASEEVAVVEAELAKLYLLLENTKEKRACFTAGLATQAKNLQDVNAELNAYLEETFVQAELLEPDNEEPQTPLEELSIETEYEKICRMLRNETEEDEQEDFVPLHTYKPDYTAPSLTSEEQRRADLSETFWAAQSRVQAAQNAFDRREYDQALEWQANYDAADRGEEVADASPEDFHLRWIKRTQELTHELIEAETAVGEAKKAAIDSGVVLTIDDRESGFVDDVDDGYRMSFEQEQIAAIPRPIVDDWLSSVASAGSPSFNDRTEEDGDEWEAEDVGMSDSVSLVAEGSERRHIDKWRQICGL